MMKHPAAIFILLLVLSQLAFAQTSITKNNDANLLHGLNNSLTESVVFDGFSPPVASRIYAYCNITAYEALRIGEPDKKSLINQLNSYEKVDDSKFTDKIDHRVVMIQSFSLVAKDLVYRHFYVDSASKKLLKRLSTKVDPTVYKNSLKAAEQLHDLVAARIKSDNYGPSRNMPKYTPNAKEGCWKPTSPTFGDALEPYWGIIKPFALDSGSQFKVAEQCEYSAEKGSKMYLTAKEVYDTVNAVRGSKDKFDISKFWDCNPLKTNIKGHLMYKTRQLTPGGHWMGITKYACQTNNTDLFTTAKIYALVSGAIADGFINCWSEKYRTDFIRPESYIESYIDKDWQPLLETPLFPEHPSGHAVVSAAASTILTKYFGNSFAFTDSTEIPFGSKSRGYHSFDEAANEAAMSRMYGGIHYRLACDEGKKLGVKVANNMLEKAKL